MLVAPLLDSVFGKTCYKKKKKSKREIDGV